MDVALTHAKPLSPIHPTLHLIVSCIRPHLKTPVFVYVSIEYGLLCITSLLSHSLCSALCCYIPIYLSKVLFHILSKLFLVFTYLTALECSVQYLSVANTKVIIIKLRIGRIVQLASICIYLF